MGLTLERPTQAPGPSVPLSSSGSNRGKRARWVWGWAYSGVLSVLLTLTVLLGYLVTGIASGTVDWTALLTSSTWSPGNLTFGGLAMIYGSAVVCVLALLLAVPVGWAAAIALSEYLPPRLAKPLRLSIELLAAVPSIVYGLIGIMIIRPFVAGLGNVPGGDSLLAAGIVLAVMIMPTIAAVSVDALAAVPGRYREAAYSLGLTRREVIRSAVLPRARSGMRAGVLLGLARALGEAIAVFLVIGRADDRLPESLGDVFSFLVRPGQTLTTKLAGPEPMLAGTSGPYFAALCALGVILLVLVAVATVWGTRGSAKGARAPHVPGVPPRGCAFRRTGSPPSSGSAPCCCQAHFSSACSASSWPVEVRHSTPSSGSRPPRARQGVAYVIRYSALFCSLRPQL